MLTASCSLHWFNASSERLVRRSDRCTCNNAARCRRRTSSQGSERVVVASLFWSFRYPSIYADFRKRLADFGTSQSEFHIFPVLICLSHIYPTMQSEKYAPSVFFPELLRIMFHCHGEKLRELAIAALLSISDASTIRQLFQSVATEEFVRSVTENQLKAMLNLVGRAL